MIIEIQFDMYKEYIYCPEELGEQINKLQNEFSHWLFDKKNDHEWWIYKNGEKYGCSYGANAFVYWLNNIYLNEEKVKAVDECDEIISQVQKKIYF